MSRPGRTQMPFTEDEMSVARAEIESMRAHWEHDQQGGHEIQKLAISKRRRAKHARWWKYLDDCDGRDDAIWKSKVNLIMYANIG